jgi:DNA repair exonuclease SbcCD ATPase subunit
MAGASVAKVDSKDLPVTKVVKLLEGMMVQSKADGDKDRENYAKFKCYCDSETAKKTKEVEGLAGDIARLESSIEKIKGSTGSLSTECAQLRADMMENEEARQTAQEQRDKENSDFIAAETDMVNAIDQMHAAIDTLAEVGADQTLEGAAADHKQAMAGFSGAFLQKRDKVKQALIAAQVFMEPKQKTEIATLIQAPFTGTYSAVSGEVVGILKNMRDTFTENLGQARETEAAQQKAHDKLMHTKEEAHTQMGQLFDEKQSQLGGNDDGLAADQQLLSENQEQKGIKEDFLEELTALCAARKKEYEERVALRSNEDAAIAEALAILNSDAAFASFGKTGATSFLQLAAVNRHAVAAPEALRLKVQAMLKKASSQSGSLRLAQVAAALEAVNPFEEVLKEIKKMIKLTDAEGVADKEKLDWCRSERESNNAALDEKRAQISELEALINELTNIINEPETGLKDSIARDEASLADNDASQKTATKDRQSSNAAYQEDIANLVAAEDLLTRAVKVLTAYYAKIEDADKDVHEAVVLSGETSEAPDGNLEKGYSGQKGQGDKVISMLEFIVEEGQKEEKVAHEDEQQAQSDYEGLMTELKEEEVKLKKSIAQLKATLAEKEKELMDAENLLKETEKEKETIIAYLASIKAGCDFMEDNFDLREERRASEKSALENAISLLKDTPAYKQFVDADHLESLGECKDKCVDNGEEHVICKACLAKVEIPGYCAGHPGTEGC